jgi:hypothetical protein
MKNGGNILAGWVRSYRFSGTRTRLIIAAESSPFEVITEASASGRYPEGETVLLFLPPGKLWAYPGSKQAAK